MTITPKQFSELRDKNLTLDELYSYIEENFVGLPKGRKVYQRKQRRHQPQIQRLNRNNIMYVGYFDPITQKTIRFSTGLASRLDGIASALVPYIEDARSRQKAALEAWYQAAPKQEPLDPAIAAEWKRIRKYIGRYYPDILTKNFSPVAES